MTRYKNNKQNKVKHLVKYTGQLYKILKIKNINQVCGSLRIYMHTGCVCCKMQIVRQFSKVSLEVLAQMLRYVFPDGSSVDGRGGRGPVFAAFVVNVNDGHCWLHYLL